MISPETKHLIKWWLEWLHRLLFTTYYLFNRRAYREWKKLHTKYDNYSGGRVDREIFGSNKV